MKPNKTEIIKKVESILGEEVLSTEDTLQGADSYVFVIKTTQTEYFIKAGIEVSNDLAVLKLLNDLNYSKAVKLIQHFTLGDVTVIVTEKAEGKLWEFTNDPNVYIESVINEISEISKFKEKSAGKVKNVLEGKGTTWKNFLKSRYSGEEEFYNWKKLIQDKPKHKDLIESGLNKVLDKIKNILEPNEYSLIHLDLNDRNIFIDEENSGITKIIDWTDAIFGDRLLEYARFRLLLTHYYPDQLEEYWQNIKLSPAEKELEDFYFFCISLDYLIWYSEGGSEEQFEFQIELTKNLYN